MKKTNRNKTLRAIAAIAAATVTVSAFAGCGKKDGAESNGEKVVKCYFPNDKQQDLQLVNDKISELTMEKAGFKVDINFLDNAAYEERMNMNMASKDNYDVAWVGYMSTMVDGVNKGGIAELDELLKETPELYASIPDYAWEQAKMNGKIYAVPNIQILYTQASLNVKKDLAEKYNLDTSKIRKTTDIEPFLEQVKQGEPNIYPFDPAFGVNSFYDIDSKTNFSAEGLYAIKQNEDGTYPTDENGKYIGVFGQEQGETKKRATILHDWYKKGYIRKDVATVVDTTMDYKAGKYATYVSTLKPGQEGELKQKYGYEWICIPITNPKLGSLSARSTMLSIGKSAKNPVEGIKFIELLNTDKEIYNTISFGIEGKHYNKVGENRIELVDGSGYNIGAAWKFGNQFNAYILPGQDDDVWEKTKEGNDTAEKPFGFGFDFDKTAVKNLITKTNNVVEEYKTIRQGVADPETYWDEYVQKLYDSGLQELIDEYARQFNEFVAKNEQ